MMLLAGCLAQPNVKQATLAPIEDSFTGGKLSLVWRPYPYFNGDNLKGALDASSPEGEPGVGVLDNGTEGGFAALSYAETHTLENFRLEVWLHVQVSRNEKGALNGIAFRVDPVQDKYYRFAAQFHAEPSLSLAYVGRDTKHFPVLLGQWKAANIPGGVPEQDGWHRVTIEVKNDFAEISWDSVRLAGGPLRLDRINSGYVGVYATYTGGRGIAETKIDGLRIQPDGAGH